MGYWIEFKGPALAPNQRRLELVGFIPKLRSDIGGGGGPGKAKVEGFHCTREIGGPVSQLISRATHTGQSFAEVILGKDSDGRRPGVQFTLVLATIASYSGPYKADLLNGRPAEEFELVFQDLKLATA